MRCCVAPIHLYFRNALTGLSLSISESERYKGSDEARSGWPGLGFASLAVQWCSSDAEEYG